MDLPSAVLTVSRLDGSSRSWRVQLTAQTPCGHEELRAALVQRFVGAEIDPTEFTLKLSGTFGAPMFGLEEQAQLFGEATEV